MLEFVFAVIKSNQNIDKLRIYEHKFLKQTSVIEVLKVFENFSKISGLKPNKSNSEIAGTGDLKWVRVALCGMQCINLNKETVQILGIHFSYNKKLEEENLTIKSLKKKKTLIIIYQRLKMF